MPIPTSGLVAGATTLLFLLSASVAAQPPVSVSWAMLIDPQAQVYEDPYRDLTPSQMEKLMLLVKVQQLLSSVDLSSEEVEELKKRAEVIEQDFRSEGLDAVWILSQREEVAARRERAAVATNSHFEGKRVELSGYLLHAASLDTGEPVAYLLPDRGLCMHLPAPPPNQVIQLVVKSLPDPLGPCIAAAVRGRLSVEEEQHHISSADGPTTMWNLWKLDVSAVSTTGSLPAE